jgi:hypothetical protein
VTPCVSAEFLLRFDYLNRTLDSRKDFFQATVLIGMGSDIFKNRKPALSQCRRRSPRFRAD